MPSRICGASSILAVAGGDLFLILPVAFFTGKVPFSNRTLSMVYLGSNTPPFVVEMGPLWIFLGTTGILLGFFAAKIEGSRNNLDLGLGFCLGTLVFLFEMTMVYIQGNFITTPSILLLFPETAVLAMAGATVLFTFDLLRSRLRGLPPTSST